MNAIDNSWTESQSQHLKEWLESQVDKEIFALNVASLSGTTPYEYLLYSPKISRRNDGRLRDGDLKKYRHIEQGGWWCNGIDPLNNYAPMMWGCFKPNRPRRDHDKIHKFIKYEHPYKEATRAFFLQVPKQIWEKISESCGIAIPSQMVSQSPELTLATALPKMNSAMSSENQTLSRI